MVRTSITLRTAELSKFRTISLKTKANTSFKVRGSACHSAHSIQSWILHSKCLYKGQIVLMVDDLCYVFWDLFQLTITWRIIKNKKINQEWQVPGQEEENGTMEHGNNDQLSSFG